MERIVDLMQQKNNYLEKFLLIGEAESINFEMGDFDNLESFYDCREKILNVIRHIEGKIEKMTHQYAEGAAVDPKVRARAKSELDAKDQLVGQILELDLKLISCIESAKSDIIKQLRTVKQGKKAVSGYRAEMGPEYRFNEEV